MPLPSSKGARAVSVRVRGRLVEGGEARFVPYPNTRGRWIGWEPVDTEAEAEWRIDGAPGLDAPGKEKRLHTSDLFPSAPPIFLRRVTETLQLAPAHAAYVRRAIADGDLEEVTDGDSNQ